MGSTNPEEMKQAHEKEDQKLRDHINANHDKVMGYNTGRSGGCFPARTKIATPNGTANIEALEAGDFVLCWDEKNNRFANSVIRKKVVHNKNAITKIEFEDGTTLRTTNAHSLLVNDSWKAVKNIQKGDCISRLGHSGTVQATRRENSEVVYNLVTEKYFTFVADNVVAHNFTWFRKLRIAYWTLHLAIWKKNIQPPNKMISQLS